MKFLELSHADELKWRSQQLHDFTTVSYDFTKNEVMQNGPNGLRSSAFWDSVLLVKSALYLDEQLKTFRKTECL
jgi:hypothetical protein